MNDIRIRQYVDDIFKKVKMTEIVIEQKEELISSLIERVKDYMAQSLSFDDAFEAAKNDIGDVNELLKTFMYEENRYEIIKEDRKAPFLSERWKIAALAPFIYIILGFSFDWWSWAWVIIPIAGIASANMNTGTRIIALSPFIYVTAGLLFGCWAWGWIIIPVSAILFQNR